jgi:hypothetical protein
VPQEFYIASDIKGFTPAVDGRVSKQLFILNGNNYRFDSRGPRSAFGSKLLSPFPLPSPRGAQTFAVRAGELDYTFGLFGDSVQVYDPLLKDFVLLLAIPDTSGSPVRWTHGYLSGIIYLCHPAVGIIFWRLRTDEVGFFKTPGAPASPIAIVINNGRLGIMDSSVFSWSAPFDGFNFIPQLGGAGLQIISQHASGTPITMSSYSKGVLVWTTDGVMRSEYTGDDVVYRHRPLNTNYRPINSFCITQMDDETTVVLDPRGLYATMGDAPQVWSPIFSEFLIEYLRLNNLRVGNNTRIEWDTSRQQLFVSISHDFEGAFFSYAFVCQLNLDKWGTMNHKHYGLGSMGELDFGMIDSDGFVRQFVDNAQRDSGAGSGDLIRSDGFAVGQRNTANGGWILSSSTRASTRSVGLNPQSGFYANGSGNPKIYPQLSLDSFIQIGYLRAFELDTNDRLTEITQLMVGSVETAPDGQSLLDSNVIVGGGDANMNLGGVDLGIRPMQASSYSVSFTSTLDGVTTFVTENPSLTRFTPAARYFTCTVPGIWHTLTVSALNPGDRFHLRSLEMTYIDGGKLL